MVVADVASSSKQIFDVNDMVDTVANRSIRTNQVAPGDESGFFSCVTMYT